MSEAIVLTPGSAPGRMFYTGMALLAVLIVLMGFAPTYYLSSVFGPRHWPLLVHVHAALFTAWVGVLLAQATLVRVGLMHIHRLVGMSALLLAIAMLPIGTLVAIGAARRGVAPAGIDPLTFMIVPLGALVVFAVLVVTGILNRRRPEWHKRFMLIATFAILTPAIARLPVVGQRPVVAFGLTGLLVVLVAARDYRLLGRIHPATLQAGGFLIASAPLRLIIGRTEAWHAFAAHLIA